MAKIVPFRQPGQSGDAISGPAVKHCRHHWDAVDGEGADAPRGIVTLTYRCRHCGALKTVSRRSD